MFLPESITPGGLAARQSRFCPSGEYLDSDGFCRSSGWYYWGRWVLAAIVIVFFIILFVTWSCINNRRRRRRGLQPRYGTGWMTGGPGYYNNQQPQPQYSNNTGGGGWFGYGGNKHSQPPPPQYTPNNVPNQYTGQTFDTNEGYYGHHQNDVPLQQPAGSYYPRAGEPVYEPPSNPPPAKN